MTYGIRSITISKKSYSVLMGPCIKDYNHEWANVTPYPITESVLVQNQKLEKESINIENSINLKGRRANQMIRD